uniref:poly [ADP-ribose] polymerase tankyrase-2 n=1 Tax=Erigeron canadensis TaxID=72917 RepID=UPI001CB8E717|nr:poly [ADP-ribose] polymerase tankyrase-2 [Erigeron canadensis]
MAVPGRHNLDGDDDEEGILFVEEGAFPEHDFEDTPPHLRDLAAAAMHGDLDGLRRALDNLDGSIDEPVEDGDTALHLTCLYGHLSCVQLLLERGASVEAKDEDGGVPLHDACAGGFMEIAQLLIAKANSAEGLKRMLESVDVEGDTPLHHAARGEHDQIVQLLLSIGASPTKTNVYGKTPGELVEPDTQTWTILEAATRQSAMAS